MPKRITGANDDPRIDLKVTANTAPAIRVTSTPDADGTALVQIVADGSAVALSVTGGLDMAGDLEITGDLAVDTLAVDTDTLVVGDGTVGFYGTAAIAKQTGVAVTAEAIHAALVALGLIGA